MFRKLMATFGIAAVLGSIAISTPAQAGYNDCDAGYVCAWRDAYYEGEKMEWDPSAVYWATPAHCMNFDATTMQDSISSMRSNYPSLRVFRFYKDINCYNGSGWWTLTGSDYVANLKGTGWNDTFSSVYVAYPV